MSEQHVPRRRVSDWDPEDHDILIELRRDVANLIGRVDGKMGDFATGLSALRTETASALTRMDERIGALETWKQRLDGATFARKEALMMAFAAGSCAAALIGTILRLTGHL